MQRLLASLVALAVFVVACGSGDATPQPSATGTETSQRAERQASVSEQQQQQEDVVAVVDEQDEPVQQLQQNQVEQNQVQQIEREQTQPAQDQAEQEIAPPQDSAGDEDDQQVVELPPEIIGEYKGVRSERHVLGDPDAPVEIRYFGDFT